MLDKSKMPQFAMVNSNLAEHHWLASWSVSHLPSLSIPAQWATNWLATRVATHPPPQCLPNCQPPARHVASAWSQASRSASNPLWCHCSGHHWEFDESYGKHRARRLEGGDHASCLRGSQLVLIDWIDEDVAMFFKEWLIYGSSMGML